MFTTDVEAYEWVESHSDEVRSQAKTIFRRYIEVERAAKKLGGKKWVDSWRWEDAISEALQLPNSSKLVASTSALLRDAARPWRLEKYDDSETFDRLLDKFETALASAGPGR